MSKSRDLIEGRDSVYSYLSLTDADLVSIEGLSAGELGEVPALVKDMPAGARGENFGDARKWLGRSLGWFQFCAVSLRSALSGAETEEALVARLGGEERRLERILHAATMAVRNAAGPFHYLARGRSNEVSKHADALLAELSGESLHRLQIERSNLISSIHAGQFAIDGARARMRELVGDSLVDGNILDGGGRWSGAWHAEPEVVRVWEAWVSAKSRLQQEGHRLLEVNDFIAAIGAVVREEICKTLEPDGNMSCHELAAALDISVRDVRHFAEKLVSDGVLFEVPASSGFFTYQAAGLR